MLHWMMGVIVALISLRVQAQQSVWPLEDRCVVEADADAWTLNGTILLTGYGGVHAYNAAW
jgi:hypothetical protein